MLFQEKKKKKCLRSELKYTDKTGGTQTGQNETRENCWNGEN